MASAVRISGAHIPTGPTLGPRMAITAKIDKGFCLLDDETWARIARSLKLSPRECEIVKCIFSDQKDLAISQQLGMSPHTVNTHLKRLYRKLHVSSRAQVVLRVFARYLLSLEQGTLE